MDFITVDSGADQEFKTIGSVSFLEDLQIGKIFMTLELNNVS